MGTKLPKNARLLVTLDSGAEVRLKAVSPMLISGVDEGVRQSWADKNRVRTPRPTYEVTTAAGVVEVHEHDATTIKEIEDEAERAAVQKALDESLADDKAFARDRSAILIDLFALDGLEVISGPSMEQWMRRRKRMGLAIPEDEEDRRLAYVKEYIISTARDITSLVSGVLELSGVSKGSVEAAAANFRDPVEGRPAAERAADTEEQLEVQPGEPVHGADGGEGLGEAAE